jgi:hypothetical protein
MKTLSARTIKRRQFLKSTALAGAAGLLLRGSQPIPEPRLPGRVDIERVGASRKILIVVRHALRP